MPRFAAPFVATLLLSATAAAADPSVQCEIRENGEPASGTMLVLEGTKEIAQTSCGKPLALPAGSYTAVLQLDGAIDGPEQRIPLTVGKDAPKPVKADFATGTLEVKITSESKAAAGMAIIRKDGKQIGTLGSGVPAHLSAGTYEIVVRHRTESKTLASVVIAKGDKKTLDVSFP
jgi:hypothetical protein